MKKYFLQAAFITCIIVLLFSCQKEDGLAVKENASSLSARNGELMGHLKQTKTFSSDVAIKWMTMQVRQMRYYPPLVGNVAYSRHYAYSGIALYEAVVPGMPAHQSIASQLNGLTGLPTTEPGAAYHWAASANAALAHINRSMFPNATDAHKPAMDSLEQSLLAEYSAETDAAIIERSVNFGKAVAEAVMSWANTDGHQNINNPYIPLDPTKIGGQYWTPPAIIPVHTVQYIGDLRRMVASSGDGAGLPAPDYANLPAMTMEVVNARPEIGTDNYYKAFWWRDFPGTSTPGHYVSILRQVLSREKPSLDVAALAYALGGIIDVDITISSWQDKFKYLLARPFNYVSVLGITPNNLLGAPHPEYPAAHATLSAANAEAMAHIFGEDYAFTDSTFYGMATPGGALEPRHFSSFREAGEEAGWSRLYGGIHYRPSIEAGFWQGRKVAHNIISTLRFRK